MASPFYLYGSSPDVLASQQGQYDDRYTRAAESNRAAATQAVLANLAAQERARQEDEAAMVRDQNNRVNLWRYGVQDQSRADEEALRLATMAEGTRRFNIGQATDDKRYAQDIALRNRGLDIQSERYKPVDVATQISDALDTINAGADKMRAKKADQFIAAETKKNRGVAPGVDAVSAAAKLNDYEIAALQSSVGALGANLYLNPATGKFQIGKPESLVNEFVPVMGKVNKDLTAYQALQAEPRTPFVMGSKQGGGYIPPLKILTPEVARAYWQRFGSRAAAEKAAQADGYTIPE